jgi:hypothetical protein
MDTVDIPAQRTPGERNLAILAVDIRRFSAFTDTQRNTVAVEFRNAIEHAFERMDLGQAWRERVFTQNAGDGIVTGFEQRHLASIVDRLPSALQGELRELHHRTGLTVRMRMGLALGPVKDLDDERIDVAPNQPIITACRIADSRPVRALLDASDEHATFLAVAVSPEVMAFTVTPDPRWIRQSEFLKVRIDMEDKQFHTDAFVHVPSPSGRLLQFGLLNVPTSDKSEDGREPDLEELMKRALDEVRPAPEAGAVRFGSVGGDVDDHSAQTGDVGRDVRNESIQTGDVSGTGAFGVVTGGHIQQDHSARTDNSVHDQSGQDHSSRYVGRDNIDAQRDATVNNVGGDLHTRYGDSDRTEGGAS